MTTATATSTNSRVTFHVPDMTCGHCASTIARAVSQVQAGARLDFDLPRKRVRIHSAGDAQALAQAIREAGYSPQQVEDAA